MSFEWTPRYSYQKVDPACCKAAVAEGGRWPGFNQCARKHIKDGWCKQHHPDYVSAKDKARQARYDAGRAQDKARFEAEERKTKDAAAFPEALALLKRCYDQFGKEADGTSMLMDEVEAFLKRS